MTAKSRFARDFVADLARMRFENVFNPYSDTCEICDGPDAPAKRRRNLESVLSAAVAGGVDALWVGLELGHGGGRRTGLPRTDDRRLQTHGTRFGLADLEPPTIAGRSVELTASAVWEALESVPGRVLLWNVFPLHPHKPGTSLSNRRHHPAEREAGIAILKRLKEQLSDAPIIAVGRHAEAALRRAGYPHDAVRHPAYGGKPDFLAGVAQLHHHRPNTSS